MENIATDSGNRVTRSLRKRLASVDSENSSRPSTPISAKLTSISEIATSPPRSTRMTRRTSISGVVTPIKTPAKRAILENVENNTPSRRSSRKPNENEESAQTGLKISIFAPLDEEIEQSSKNTIRVIRSQSESPHDIKTVKTCLNPKDSKDEHENKEIRDKNKNSKFPPLDVEIEQNSKNTIIVTRSQSKSPNDIKMMETYLNSKESKGDNENENKEIKDKNKNSKFAPLEEEIEQNSINTIRVTRSQSKSPHDIKMVKICLNPKELKGENENENKEVKVQNIKTDIPKKRKVGPKSKTRPREENLSDVEFSALDEIENIKNKSSDTEIIITNSINDDLNAKANKCMEENENGTDNEKAKLIVNDTQLEENISENDGLNCTEQKDILKTDRSNIEILEKSSDENSHQKKCEESTKPPCQSNKENNIEKENLNISSTDNNQETINVQHSFDIENELINSPERIIKDNNINTSFNENVDFINVESNDIHPNNVNDCTTADPKEKAGMADKVEIISIRNLTSCHDVDGPSNINVCETSLKKVSFFNSPNDMLIKNVYPKTPVSAKSLNKFKDISSCADDDSFEIKNNSVVTDNKIETKKEAETQIIETIMTPIHDLNKSSNELEAEQSLTSINIESSSSKLGDEKNNVQSEELLSESKKNQDQNVMETHVPKSSPIKLLGNNEDHFPGRNKEELKWINPCVRVETATGSKLDVFINQNNTNTNDCSDNASNVGKQIEKNQKGIIISSEDIEEPEADEEDLNELSLGEESDKPLHDFHDDEAMEICDYESGNSMDSEERREIDENEIPIHDESIGSNTTECDQDDNIEEECVDSYNTDSFIVSDNEEPAHSDIDIEEENELDEGMGMKEDKKNKKIYKRILRQEDSSSSDEQVEDDQQINDHQDACEKHESRNESFVSQPAKEKIKIADENVNEIKDLNEKMESNSCESIFEATNLVSKSSEHIIISESTKLSESAWRLYCSSESESDEEKYNNPKKQNISRNLNQSDCFNKSSTESRGEKFITKRHSGIIKENNVEKCLEGGHTNSTTDESSNKTVTSESDADKENECKLSYLTHDKSKIELTVSFSNCNKPKENQDVQQSFTIDVSVLDKDKDKPDIAVSDEVIKLKESELNFSSPPNNEQEHEKLTSEDVNYVKNIRHMPLPLGNPLIRTRRQSLALPTNPDMQICSSPHTNTIGKRTNRKSLGILSSSDFNPSQSFVDSIELQKSEDNQLVAKRKRLSKSFCGASEKYDNSVVDIDVRHLHKRSKLMSENSISEGYQDSIENINSSKLFTKFSSTPHEKLNKPGSYNKHYILQRCDEILEAANLAKLKDKIHNKKNKVKKSKRLSKKKSNIVSSDETKPDNTLRGISQEIIRKDKTKAALTKAIRAADALISQKKNVNSNMKEYNKLLAKQLAPDVLEALGQSTITKKKENIPNKDQIQNVHTSLTSAGNIKELPQSPKKRKKSPKYIQLRTGKVSVEPVTPKKRIVQALNGMQFTESPITPSATGFKVRQISSSENDSPSSSSVLRKRKRCYNEPFKDCTKKSQWTKSGFFIEENFQKNSQSPQQKTKKRPLKREEHNTVYNFKENAMMRSDIRRTSKRELLQLKERRLNQGHY